MKITCIIIDDEPLARKLLIDYCNRVPFLALVADFSSGLEALSYIAEHEIDLIFLDIKMPDISGLDLNGAMQKRPKVIFTTAFAEYAVDAFELDALDYLLKPFDFPRFLKAVNKVTELQIVNSDQKIDIPKKDFMLVKDGRNLIKVRFQDIQYIKGQKDYVMFVTRDKKVMSLMNMRDLQDSLPSHQFVRIHQSYIINFLEMESMSNDKVLLADAYLPISQTYKVSFKEFLKNQGVG